MLNGQKNLHLSQYMAIMIRNYIMIELQGCTYKYSNLCVILN
jgi:hypothetical protein